jgi:5'-nucleotidase / UDP-sugar diphosphatase
MNKLICLFLLVVSTASFAKKVQIIHINDLHSYFTGYIDGRGGYSKIKTKIDELKASAAAKGIQSIVLDAGDWGEGNSYFLTEDGSNSYKALGLLGVDVTIVGNHDHMMGGNSLSEQIAKANISTKILSANLIQTPEMNLEGVVIPETQLIVDGLKIHIIGLSTPEPHHQAALLPGFMAPPEFYVFSLAKAAKLEKKADLVIALTHLGVSHDKKIAKKSEYLDIIVGGHSHDRLEEIIWQKNNNNKDIGIVQTGAHGLAVGSLIIDVDGKENKVVSYKLHDINLSIAKNETVEQFMDVVLAQRNDLFDGRWDEVIGTSEITITGAFDGHTDKIATCWGQHMARIVKSSTGADVGLHLNVFAGMQSPAGPVTLGNLIDNFPHVRYFGDKGWEMSTFSLKGKILKPLLKAIVAIRNVVGLNADGFTYKSILFPIEIPFIGGKALAFKLRINGKKINKDQEYTVSIPSELEYVLRTMLSKKAEDILPKVHSTGKFFWTEMEEYVRANSPIKCIK